MSFDSQDSQEQSPQEASDAVLKFIEKLFKEYCDFKEVPKEHVCQVNPIGFLEWVKADFGMQNVEGIARICEEYNIEESTFNLLMDIANDPGCVNRIAGVWPQITLGSRGIPANEVESVHNICLIRWKDGRVTPLSSYVVSELCSDDGVFTDGNVCTLVQVGARTITQMILNSSLDELHDTRSTSASDNAYEVVMGLIVKMLQGATIIDSDTNNQLKVSSDMIESCRDVQRVLQSMFRPPIPPELQKQIELKRRQQAKQREGNKPRGGWDE